MGGLGGRHQQCAQTRRVRSGEPAHLESPLAEPGEDSLFLEIVGGAKREEVDLLRLRAQRLRDAVRHPDISLHQETIDHLAIEFPLEQTIKSLLDGYFK